MIIRKTGIEDLENVMGIYERAEHFMAETGNPNQWAPGYPSRDMIVDDITRGVSYVMEENGSIEAVFAYIEGVDPTYGNIVNGAWRSFGMYGTIHRLASAGRQKGIARQCFLWCEQQALLHGCASLRADTHMDNKIMQQALLKSGFLYCGIIHLGNGAPRLAYERLLERIPGAVQGGMPATGNGYTANFQQPQKGDGIALGVTSMVLGIVSLLLFCTCINFVTAIAAVVFGIVQIVKNKEKSFAVVGIVTAALSLVLALVLWGTFAVGVSEMGVDAYEEFYDSYYGDYYYDDYDYDYNDDYYDYYEEYYYEEEGGAEFL